jgi:hypothetical protein
MIIEAGRASKLSLETDNDSARYDSSSVLRASAPATLVSSTAPTRLTLELSRGLGGMIMRALIGAEFFPGSDVTHFEVLTAAAPFDSGVGATCASSLGKPLIPGLPKDFAPPVLAGLEKESAQDPLPAGTLRIDRAGYDLIGSSEAAFFQVASLLRSAFSAMAAGDDVAARLTDRLTHMPVHQAG